MIQRDKFILHIQEDGARLYFLVGQDVQESWEVQPADTAPDFMLEHPKVPLGVVIDTASMVMKNQDVTQLNWLERLQLLRHIKAELAGMGRMHGAKMYKDEGRWFIQRIHHENLQDWIQWIRGLDNPLSGIHSMPHLAMQVVQCVRNRPQWQMLVTLQEGGGLRFCLYHHDHLEWTRLLALDTHLPTDQMIDVLNSKLKETYQHLQRTYPTIGSHLNIHVVVDDEVRKGFKYSFLPRHQVHMLTPFQLFNRLGLGGKVPFRLIDLLFVKLAARSWVSNFPLTMPGKSVNRFGGLLDLRKMIKVSCAVLGVLILERGVHLMTTAQSVASLENQVRMLQPKKVVAWG